MPRSRRDKLKVLGRLVPAALLFGFAVASAAEPSADRAAAAAAFESGDYLSAVQLYSKSREAAAKSGDNKALIADTVALARAHLHHGAPARARQLLAEFNQRFSVRDSGILEGEILAAEGKIAEAEKFFRELIAKPDADARIRGEAELALTYLLLLSGDSGKTAEALAILEKLEDDEHFAAEARLRRICVLIRCGKAAEALELAGRTTFSIAHLRRRLELLKLLALLHTGAADEFDSGWNKLRGEMPIRPDKLAWETLDQAAERAMKASRPDWAERYWEDAYHYAGDNEVRRDLLRKLFNCCAQIEANKAAEVAERYAELFPESENGEQLAERARILTEAGRLLSSVGAYRKALDFFRMVADDSKMPTGERRAAAGDAALAAENIDDQETAKRYFESLVSTAPDLLQLQESQMSYAEYIIRRKDFPGAERLLRGIVDVTDPKLADRGRRLLLQSLEPQGKFDAALAEAEALRRSADPVNSGFGEFHAALMTEKLGRAAEARRRYLNYVRLHPEGECVGQARFAAAKMAEETGDYAAAAKEFYAYAMAYPKTPEAVGALFLALRNGGLGDDLTTAVAAFEALGNMKGAGAEYYAAGLQLLDFMRRGGKADAALELLDKMDRSKCGKTEDAMLELMRAKLLTAGRDRGKAIAAAEQVLSKYPGEPAAADAAFLAGKLYLEDENPKKALEKLLEARKLRPLGNFADACSVRVADCRIELYKSGSTSSADLTPQGELAAAAAEFERLASEAVDPNIRLMCRCRLGWCREEQKDPEAAVSAYYRVLLYAAELKRSRRSFDPKWCSRSAYAALHILVNHRWPDADQRGAAIIDAVRALELPGGDAEFETVREEFKQRYLEK